MKLRIYESYDWRDKYEDEYEYETPKTGISVEFHIYSVDGDPVFMDKDEYIECRSDAEGSWASKIKNNEIIEYVLYEDDGLQKILDYIKKQNKPGYVEWLVQAEREELILSSDHLPEFGGWDVESELLDIDFEAIPYDIDEEEFNSNKKFCKRI